MTFKPWLRRHPLLAGCAVYGICWGGILVVAGTHRVDLVHLRPVDTGVTFAAMLLGTSVGGSAITMMADG